MIGKRIKGAAYMLVLLLTSILVLSGCRNYEPIDVPTVETAGADIAPSSVADESEEAQSSALKPDVTMATAPEMKVVDETVYVTGSNVNLRTTSSTTSESLGTVKLGDELKRVGYNENWSKVVLNGKECYISSQFLSTTKPAIPEETTASQQSAASGEVKLNSDWKYAGFSKINSGAAVLYRSEASNRKNKVICVNAGHGTKGGGSVKTQCHPDGTPKVTGGTTGAGATSAVAVSSGMTFADGTAEAKVTLAMAKVFKDKLLAKGYDVLMIRESDDVQLDNVARTIIANNAADCHISLHWDSTGSNKGVFYMSVPNVASYRQMEPVASNWKSHNALGENLVAGLKGAGLKLFSNGAMEMDLTQTSYSTVPSVDIELGDKASDHSAAALDKLGNGLVAGVESFFEAQ